MIKTVKNALISVFHKEGLDELIEVLKSQNVTIYSTGGTYDFLLQKGVDAKTVESITSYPSILGGRVKTLHPSVFGGILARRELAKDMQEVEQYNMPEIDMVVVDLYPFARTVENGGSDEEIIEKIDIGGVSLLRAAAKNFKDVLVVSSVGMYGSVAKMLKTQGGTRLSDRAAAAAAAITETADYDTTISQWLRTSYSQDSNSSVKIVGSPKVLRYGENPHQKGFFIGCMDNSFEQLHGKEISYNNLLDIDAAYNLMGEFPLPENTSISNKYTVAVIKHSNPCGWAIRTSLLEAYKSALACDPLSAYGGIVVCNSIIDQNEAMEMNKLFIEVLIAPDYTPSALEVLKSKKNRIILKAKSFSTSNYILRSCVGGYLYQEKDSIIDISENRKCVTDIQPNKREISDLYFANILVKHCKSNAIVLVKDGTLLASGVGQTSRVDSLKHAIEKAISFGFDLNSSVMASDAFFPFSDCVEIAHKNGIESFIQPGGSVRDQDSIDYCKKNGLKMVLTGIRHFRH